MYTLYITNCRLVKIDNRKYIHDEDTSHTHIKTSALALQIMCIAHTHTNTQRSTFELLEAHV